MQHIRSLEGVHKQNVWLTIGSFDGIHRAHQEIIQRLTDEAHDNGALAAVLSFHPHPSVVLGKRTHPRYLTKPDERAALLEPIGVDLFITHPFNQEVAQMSAREFLNALLNHIDIQELWVGHDFAMGHDREGDVPTLRRLGEDLGYRLRVIPAIQVEGEIVSSSRIREHLAAGEVAQAAHLLGRPYRLSGAVVPGDGRGKTLGIPTANLLVDPKKALPETGVYACIAHGDFGRRGAVVNIGVRPTFEASGEGVRVEAHLLDFEGDLYGQTVALDFLERLRGERRFSGPEELVDQIREDIAQARRIFARTPEHESAS